MSNEILFYDLSISSSIRTGKCFAPSTLYVHSKNSRHPRLIL